MSLLAGLVPGLGLAKGMALGLVRFFQPKATIMYPEQAPDVSPKFRGRLQLLYDEWGTLKCETCFQCAQACPIECIDMGGIDTKGRYHVHWGPPETYGERREESAMRRSGRTVPDRAYEHFEPIDVTAVDEILGRYDYDPREMLRILEATNEAYGYLPVAALKRISSQTGAWYAMLYGTASYYRHLRWTPPGHAIQICRCTSCLMAGGGRILEAIEEALGVELGGMATDDGTRIEQLPSHLPGAPAPLVALDGDPQVGLRPDRAAPWATSLAELARPSMTMTRLLATPEGWPQVLLARSNAQVSVPDLAPETGTDLDRAVALGAFEGLRRAIDELGPEGAIAEVERANLRGRGGAGHPAAAKWRAARNQEAARRFVVANGYGADPATFTDMVLMERDPWAILEGIAIVAYAIRATEAVIAVRAEYAEAIRRLDEAIVAAEEVGFLGTDILEAGFDLTVTVRVVQGAYMLGEETVLLKAIEGKRGQPEQRPPYPATRGLFGHPTVVHNVATLAAVSWIMANGAAAFAAIGSPEAPGTALVQVRGLETEGIAEVPTGTSLREIVGLVAAFSAGRPIKAVLVGGPSGGLLPADLLDTPYEFDALRAVGGHVGSGSVVVADESACVVDLARLLTRFCADEACGKTIPCRIGLRRVAEIAERATTGRARPQDPQLLTDLCHDVAESGLCDHERLATLPLTTGMRYFRTELDEHFLRGNCPAGVCRPIAATASTH